MTIKQSLQARREGERKVNGKVREEVWNERGVLI